MLTNAPVVVRMLLCLLLGICAALGQAPFDLPLSMILAQAGAFAIWRAQPSAQAAWWMGWAFGTGYFGLALIWIVEPFQVDVGRHGWMAPFALVFMSAGLALFWAAAFWGARRLSTAAITLVLTWTLAEVLRAYMLTGFPWASPAQVLVEGPASRLLAYAGPHGATFGLMLLAWCFSLRVSHAGRAPQRVGQAALLIAAGLALHLPQALPASAVTDHVVRLVQPNAEQHLKWQPELAELFYERQLSLTAAPGSTPPDLVVWPETAIPWRLEHAAPVLAEISATAAGPAVVLGALRTAPDGVRNALAVLGPDGTVTQVYDKHHLVPFGEYIPLARLAGRVGLTGLAARGAGFSPGPGPTLLDFGPLGRALPLICYEAVFAHDVNRPPERPEFLLQITNDAWFGDYSGPQQHLAQARMRAIEQGLPLLRAANTGISAVIDPLGRITASLPMGVSGFVDAALPAPAPPTLYSRTGDLPVVLVLMLGLFAQLLLFLRHEQTD
jgi:apolipoprotein N-acyltransferase